ncbi:uncharacterized protein BDW43DRAFT_260117 [Aspergillus alliaceus]|uniref:uncharacterized protein n=1 Tax=Petromyces alliaceus TaxID=209559 RepID=UPI0012A65F32|nr:uncharacterized protein BDW43DRAFT_260117 [Aspergillus alliaceus]KAB8238888.1 hypothetical protein BDW43DRAFT_260117 [Aspergillus alliaceus]
MGFLKAYTAFIQYESDYHTARHKNLIPDSLTDMGILDQTCRSSTQERSLPPTNAISTENSDYPNLVRYTGCVVTSGAIASPTRAMGSYSLRTSHPSPQLLCILLWSSLPCN